MSDIAANLVPEIRGAKAEERGRGHTVPAPAVAANPATASQADRVTKPARGRQRDFPIDGETGPAMQGSANHFGWRVQGAMEIRSYAETIAVRNVEPAGVLTIDPAIATVWRVLAAGSLTLAVTDLPGSTVGGEYASRVLSLVLYIQRNAGAEITWPAGTMFGLDVLDPNGDGDQEDSLLAPPDGARIDVFVLNLVPTLGWIGYVAAIGLTVA